MSYCHRSQHPARERPQVRVFEPRSRTVLPVRSVFTLIPPVTFSDLQQTRSSPNISIQLIVLLRQS